MSYRRPVAPRNAPSRVAAFALSSEYRATVAAASYLGKKGYTISKSVLSESDIALLRKELMLAPELSGPSYGAAETAFPVYRENANKFYVPRFYGVSRYGAPARSEIHANVETINVAFAKPLRDYQNEIADVYMRHIASPLTSSNCEDTGNGGILEVKTGRGKCLARNTQVRMFNGTTKMSQNIEVGDQLMGDDSAPRNVLSLARGREMMYRVSDFCHKESYTVNESHILSLEQSYWAFNSERTDVKIVAGEKVDISVLDYLTAIDGREESVCIRGYRVPVVFPEVALEMNPYMLGCWLGARCARIDSVNIAWTEIPGAFEFLEIFPDPLQTRIPHTHLCNSRANQLQLLAGIIDACGEYVRENNCYYILSEYAPFAADLKFLVRSLGFVANDYGENGIFCFGGSKISELPVRTSSLVSRNEPYVRVMESELSYELTVKRLKEDDYFGFEIDGNRRFVLGDCTVTHNTVIALKLVSQIKQKTLIIVHKEFLADQWKERIEEFLPSASVGRIQGAVFDVEGRDIVIGMVQTLYNRPLAEDAFAGFGLTIVDEVHRIGSEEFSKTLLRVATPHMLGISATVNRKDGLEKLLYMFMGAKIYKDDSVSEDPVCVRAIHYSHADPEYNEPILDFRGNPAFSSMVARLCAASHRSDFLVRVLADLVEESPQAQIMVLAHQRNLLTYLYAAIEHRQIASVGYYVGGSKPAVLKETEGKQIVLATFSMAAEALDIKTLSTLFMVTPKSDIVQSVGRILRAKHATPIIVDIVDSIQVFKNQFIKRRQFYKSNNYRIRSIECGKYTGFADMRGWKSVFEPRGGAKVALLAALSSDSDSDGGHKVLTAKCEITLSDEDLRIIAE